MSTMYRHLRCIFLAGLPLACALAFAQVAPVGNILKGQQTYLAVGCWQCHGSGGQGGDVAGPRLAANGLTYDLFLRQLRVPRSEMPPYESQVLSDADAADIYAYVRSIPASKSASAIPLLNRLK
jgi:mono/diheme cytochrome c family protein